MYLFGFVAYAGIFLMLGKWIPFGCFVVLYAGQLVRVRREEGVLEEAFGAEYRSTGLGRGCELMFS